MSIDTIIHLENGRLADDTPFTAVNNMVTAAVNNGHVVIHFHGGLVPEDKGRQKAARLTQVYQHAGAYPLFPVWESGLLETLKNNFDQLGRELFFKFILKRVVAIVKRKLMQSEGERSANVLPALLPEIEARSETQFDVHTIQPLSQTEVLVLEMELQQDPELHQIAQSLSASLTDTTATGARSGQTELSASETLMDPASMDKLVDRPDPSARGIISTAKLAKAVITITTRTIMRYLNNRDHGLHATIVEEILREFYLANIGASIWKQMKGDTLESFSENPERFGGTAILTVLKQHIENGATPKVTLIGHSAGAIFATYFLKHAAQQLPENIKFNLILLAPAITFELAAQTLTPYQQRIQGLRIFTMTDDNEQADSLIPVLYPHSLLYFVSGVVEAEADTPLLGMQRYYDNVQYSAEEFGHVETLRQFINGNNQNIIWSRNTGSGPGLETGALKHGDFDNDPKTLASIQHILQHGF